MFQLPFWGKLMQLSQKPLYLMVLGVLLNSLIVFVLCLAADLVRIQLFRLLHINKFLDLISDWLSKYMNLFCEKVKKCSDGNSVNNKKLSQGKLKDQITVYYRIDLWYFMRSRPIVLNIFYLRNYVRKYYGP